MLIEFRVENHRSIAQEQVLTFEAASLGDPADPRPREVQGAPNRLLPVAAIYGANASGKSNVLSAMSFFSHAIRWSYRHWAPEGGIPLVPFAWAEPDKPSTFEVTFVLSEVRYCYGFVANSQRFVEEWLHAWPRGRKQVWFERELVDGVDRYRHGEHLGRESQKLEAFTRPNALFLSVAAQMAHPSLSSLYRWLVGIKMLAANRSALQSAAGRRLRPNRQLSLFPEPQSGHKEGVLSLLRVADLGITDVSVDDEGRALLCHGGIGEDAWMPIEEESQGTQTLFHLAPLILETLTSGGTLIIDELEASLHPLLALRIVNLFNSPTENPKNAQLVFSTHDTHLLGSLEGEPPLRRDQVWFTEKDPAGATVLYPLTDFKPRKAENLQRGYLQGRYGAIPFVGGQLLTGERPEP